MNLEYAVLGSDYKSSPGVERRIQQDINWIHQGEIKKEIREQPQQPPIYLVDCAEFESSVSIKGARALGYVPKTKRIHDTDGCILGWYDLPKPLEELTDLELHAISKEGAKTLLRLDMLRKLRELAIKISD